MIHTLMRRHNYWKINALSRLVPVPFFKSRTYNIIYHMILSTILCIKFILSYDFKSKKWVVRLGVFFHLFLLLLLSPESLFVTWKYPFYVRSSLLHSIAQVELKEAELSHTDAINALNLVGLGYFFLRWNAVLHRRLTLPSFVLLLSTLVCYHLTQFILGFFFVS